MNRIFTVLSIAASLAACAAPNAPQEFALDPLDGPERMTLGTVESVRVVPVERDIHAYEEPPELRIRPELAEQMVIRLDDGGAVTVVLKGMQRFQEGERVRVLSHTYSPYGTQVFHE